MLIYMNKSYATESEKGTGNHVRLSIYKIPKKNHNAMVENQKHFTDIFRRHGCDYQGFQLTRTVIPEGFISMATVVSADHDEEVWLDFESYRDHNQMENVISKLMNDESALSLMKQYLRLLSPGSSPMRGEFIRLSA
jgi:uncharacterized protein YbaA (DUF1428 family)